ncbi:MAG TPA: NIPSNAP family protein [Gaiellaceae bacterium]|nr:NIPSNAP family protein [Gaiellaceae bacterium]
MKRWQLRMYRIAPGEVETFVREWREHVRPLRESMGFEVLGPWVGEDDRFVWIIGHEDLEAADAAYYASPERAAIDPDPARLLTEAQTLTMDER